MSRFFTSLGRFSVRFRFLIVVAWIAVTILAVHFLPSLGDVAKDTTSGFLPATSPSMEAAAMAAPFQDASLAPATLVVARSGGLTAAVNAFSAGPEAQGVVDAIRSTFTSTPTPAGLQIHLTGQLATQIDTVAAS